MPLIFLLKTLELIKMLLFIILEGVQYFQKSKLISRGTTKVVQCSIVGIL